MCSYHITFLSSHVGSLIVSQMLYNTSICIIKGKIKSLTFFLFVLVIDNPLASDGNLATA
jgi:hypothetical protein